MSTPNVSGSSTSPDRWHLLSATNVAPGDRWMCPRRGTSLRSLLTLLLQGRRLWRRTSLEGFENVRFWFRKYRCTKYTSNLISPGADGTVNWVLGLLKCTCTIYGGGWVSESLARYGWVKTRWREAVFQPGSRRHSRCSERIHDTQFVKHRNLIRIQSLNPWSSYGRCSCQLLYQKWGFNAPRAGNFVPWQDDSQTFTLGQHV